MDEVGVVDAIGEEGVVAARYWHRLEDGRIQCDLCPRFCRLHDGQRGLCFVRARSGDGLVLTTYGRSSGFCVDPIEKKPLYHFLPGTPVLSFGTAGCNLSCRFCQNWDISKSREMDKLADRAAPDAIARAAREAGCRSVAFTYNDPVIFLEYAVDVAKACRAIGIRTVAVTAGYIMPEPATEFFGAMDAANVDLKAFTQRFYRELCAGDLEPVKETIRWLVRETACWTELTTLLIPGENDDRDEIAAIAGWVAGELGPEVPLHFTAFHPDFKLLDRHPTPASTLHSARELALSIGVKHCYTGNIRDEEGQSTTCAGCGTRLIARDGYDLTGWDLGREGACPSCGRRLAGVFEEAPGSWGSRRARVRIGGSP